MEIYLVGGAIRDNLLNLAIKEKDYVVVGSSEAEMLANNFLKVGKDFPVFLEPKTKEEYALARTEKKVGKGYYGFQCNTSKNVTLKDDLMRRDLTINAMALPSSYNIENIFENKNEIIDFFGGINDLEKKVLRHISDAFIEDPLRILRVARFKAKLHHLGFEIAHETMNLMQKMVASGELSDISVERIWLEIYKALGEKSPEEFFIALKNCGALKIIFPALDKLWRTKQNQERHFGLNAGIHTMSALKNAAELTTCKKTRFAVLCHDLGKGVTPKEKLPYHIDHDENGIPIIDDWCKKYNVPKDFKKLAIAVCKYHVKLFHIFKKPTLILKILEGLDAFRNPDIVAKFATACFADLRGIPLNQKNMEKYYLQYEEAEFLKTAFEKIKKIDTTKLQGKNLTGKDFGLAVQKIREKIIEELLKNKKEMGSV